MASAFADALGLRLFGDDELSGLLEVKDIHNVSHELTSLAHCPCNVSDAIVLSEFSEVKGPISLCNIPSGVHNTLDIDIEDFILKIMSVDYQANSSGNFRFSNDTQVLQTDVMEGIHAYIHYFTLFDLSARGFVRPLCLAYISKNRCKLEYNIVSLREAFLKVTSIMKYENRLLFLEDVTVNLQYLKEVQYGYFKWKQRVIVKQGKRAVKIAGNSMEDTFMHSVNIDQLIDQQNDYASIMKSAGDVEDSPDLKETLSLWKAIMMECIEMDVNQYVLFSTKYSESMKPIMCQKSLTTEGNLPTLKPIPVISPFGLAFGLWKLFRIHEEFNKCSLELMGGSFWKPDVVRWGESLDNYIKSSLQKDDVHAAVSNSAYVQLLTNVLPCKTTEYSGNSIVSYSMARETTEANVITSGNEASSSYYSAPESVNDVLNMKSSEMFRPSSGYEKKHKVYLRTTGSSGSSESVKELTVKQQKRVDVGVLEDWSSDSSDCVDSKDPEIFEFPNEEIWSKCIWNGNAENIPNYPGRGIQHFFHAFSRVAQHIMYSLLIGRTVVIAGSTRFRHRVHNIISAIVYLVPVPKGAKYLRWHKGILVPAHIKKFKVIGLCIAERLTVHDMISHRDKNLVTILDVNTKQIFGPAYYGTLLKPLAENFHRNFLSDESLIMYLQSVFMKIEETVYIFNALKITFSDDNGVVCNSKIDEIIRFMELSGCDSAIVKYLEIILKEN